MIRNSANKSPSHQKTEQQDASTGLKTSETLAVKRQSQLLIIGRQFWRNKGAVLGACLLALLIGCAVSAPLIAPSSPIEQSDDSLVVPNVEYPMGTDALGRNVLSRVIFGARISLGVGVGAVAIALLVGATIGILGGYFGGRVDAIVVMVIDVFMSFPALLVAMVIASLLGPTLRNVMIAVGIGQFTQFARVIRSTALVEKEEEYITAARAIGCGQARIIARHIVPNTIAPLLVLASVNMGWAILDAAALGFLGLGAQPPTPEWGNMVNAGRAYIQRAPWLIWFPGLAIMMAVLGANLLGDGLRDALDPKLRR